MTPYRPIIDGKMNFGGLSLSELVYGQDNRGAFRELAKRQGRTIPAMTEILDHEPLMPYVAQGRWLIHCPSDRCESNEYWWPEENLFMCISCWNRDYRGLWLRVAVPSVKDQVERVLLVRPDNENRNWHEGEDLAKLVGENTAHGLSMFWMPV